MIHQPYGCHGENVYSKKKRKDRLCDLRKRYRLAQQVQSVLIHDQATATVKAPNPEQQQGYPVHSPPKNQSSRHSIFPNQMVMCPGPEHWENEQYNRTEESDRRT